MPVERLLGSVRSVAEIDADAPKSLPANERKGWSDTQRKSEEESAMAAIDGLITPGSDAGVVSDEGKLSFRIDEQVVARLFLSATEMPLVETQWRAVAIDFAGTGTGDAKRLIDRLRKLVVEAEPALREQIVTVGRALAEVSAVLREDEQALHELTAHLFELTDAERRMVEQGR